MKIVGVVFVAIWALFAPAMATAEDGLLVVVTGDESVSFDRKGLEQLGVTTVETSTIWTEGIQLFQGVKLSSLLEHLDIQSGTLKATALNEYSVDIPLDDPTSKAAVIAFSRNGEHMKVRDNGPLWLIYPFDSDESLQTEVVYSRSIWQLVRFELLP